MNEAEALAKMVPPSQKRPHIWRNGVMQIFITRSCDKACFHCTQGSNLAGKAAAMTPEEFEQAVLSLKDYWGVIGVFGGNPVLHKQFDEICRILRKHVPFPQRGLWCNKLFGKGAICRRTFNPQVSNLNVHLDEEARAEFIRDWPEARTIVKGFDNDCGHSAPYVAMQDVEPDESKRWSLIANCDINKDWSAIICPVPGKGLRAYFCELAGAQAMLHANDPNWPDTGLPVEPGWWKRPMTDFAAQVRLHCHACGIPLKRDGQFAVNGEFEEVSRTHADIYRPKDKNRPVHLVQLGDTPTGKVERVTLYVENGREMSKQT